ncbi:hypothetical protein [Paraburkholderia silvatlantica]|uniref:hypothetical protein n=1 Tax=Paraburkholderia silvatlantica TaxID=321895 RepID=UPI0015E880F4|nr:hypothetical protein [Paraburkholderia silvatlantica]
MTTIMLRAARATNLPLCAQRSLAPAAISSKKKPSASMYREKRSKAGTKNKSHP